MKKVMIPLSTKKEIINTVAILSQPKQPLYLTKRELPWEKYNNPW
jgi:hypothetical protein